MCWEKEVTAHHDKSPWSSDQREDARLLIPPDTRPVRANIPYRTPLAVSERATSCVPPAPRLETALNMPTVAKQVIPVQIEEG